MRIIQDEGSRPIKIWTEDVEDSALAQLRNIAKLPFIDAHGVAAMPDVHYGVGATVGSVIATNDAIIPAAVGVDIGCGMSAVRLSGARAEHLPVNLSQIRSEFESTVPVGFEKHALARPKEKVAASLYGEFRWMEQKHPRAFARRKESADKIISSQFGSLGG